VTDEVLTRRQLGRALLARQHLLSRAGDLSALTAVEHLVGLQAQAPMPPYYGLWSRLEGFDPHELGRLLTDREVVRMTLMRGTIHLVSVRDALVLRPLTEVVAARGFSGAFGGRMGGVDTAVLGAAVREILDTEGAPLTARELGRRLVERGIGDDLEAIANAARIYAPVVQVPPRGVWGAGGQAIDDVVLRYLGAFGPASVLDAQNWSGLTKLAAVFDRLRPQLVTFRSEDGRELFDLPDAPRPAPDTPAPVRLLGEFDNVLLGHADRSRVIPPDAPSQNRLDAGRSFNHLLVDGELRAIWWLERDGRRSATLAIRPFGRLSRADREAVGDEARAMVDFAGHDAAVRDVRFDDPVG
jgi:hypothetical protein